MSEGLVEVEGTEVGKATKLRHVGADSEQSVGDDK